MPDNRTPASDGFRFTAASLAPVVVAAIAAAVAYTASGLGLWSSTGPGAGFFPFAAACGMGVMCIPWLVGSLRRPRTGTGFQLVSMLPVLAQVAVIGLFTALMPAIGFVAAACLVLVATGVIAGEKNWVAIIILTAIAAFGTQWLFGLLGTTL